MGEVETIRGSKYLSFNYNGEVFNIGDRVFVSSQFDNQYFDKCGYITEIDDAVISIRTASDNIYVIDRGNIVAMRHAEYTKPDNVNHPSHYKSESGLEAIDVIKAFTSDLKGFEATHTGNILKYVLRWKHKNGIEDLKKAQWYLNDLIKELEKEND